MTKNTQKILQKRLEKDWTPKMKKMQIKTIEIIKIILLKSEEEEAKEKYVFRLFSFFLFSLHFAASSIVIFANFIKYVFCSNLLEAFDWFSTLLKTVSTGEKKSPIKPTTGRQVKK